MVRRLAYALYLRRGGTDGREYTLSSLCRAVQAP
ncbi:MAG: hypothetical protein ACI4N8_09440 [Megasphaera sp.]